jgi:hypothetical protein
MDESFASIYVIDLPQRPRQTVTNSVVVATKQRSTLEDFVRNAAGLQDSLLIKVRDYALLQGRVRVWSGTGLVFTDDRAPVESVVDQMILNYVQGR